MPPPSWLLSTLARNGADQSLAVDPALEPDGRPGKESNAEGVVRAGDRIQLLLQTADQGLIVVGEIDNSAETGELIGIKSEEHTSELQNLMRHSYACFCLKTKKTNK